MPLLDAFIPSPGSTYAGGILSRENMRVLSNPSLRRPYLDSRDRPCVTVNTGRWTVEKGERVPLKERRLVKDLLNDGWYDEVLITANATSLRKEQWIQMDQAVEKEARPRLKAWSDLMGNNPMTGFRGMAKMTLEYESMDESGEAIVDMDALGEGRNDSPLFRLRSLPLPITHSDFSFSQRRLEISGPNMPLDLTMAENASRRVAEKVERTVIGIDAGASYGYQSTGVTAHDTSAPSDGHGSALGGSTVYGYLNYPHRLTKNNFTVPTTSNAPTTYAEVLVARNQLFNQDFHGPFALYHSIDWSPFMDNVFSSAGGNNPSETLRTMLLKIPDIKSVQRLDYLTSTFTLLFVQQTSNVARAVNGMDLTTVQWPSMGGMRTNYKVMCIWVPLMKSTYSGKCGILHGTTA